MEWINLLKNLGIFSILVAGVSWVIKKYFEKLFDKDLEKFKADLEKQSIEFRIRYEKLHSERIEVIKEVYKKIVKTYKSFSSLINPLQSVGEPTESEKGKDAAKNANDLSEYYEENRIFFEEKLAEEIDLLLSEFRKIWGEFQASRMSKEFKDHKTMLDQWSNAWKQIQEQIPSVKKQLENKFRNILGITDGNPR